MTEGNPDEVTQQLSENNEADEKPVQDGPPDKGTEENSLQLASGNNLFIRPA